MKTLLQDKNSKSNPNANTFTLIAESLSSLKDLMNEVNFNVSKLSLMSAFSPKLPNDSDAQNLGEDDDLVNMSVTSNESFIPDEPQFNVDLNC